MSDRNNVRRFADWGRDEKRMERRLAAAMAAWCPICGERVYIRCCKPETVQDIDSKILPCLNPKWIWELNCLHRDHQTDKQHRIWDFSLEHLLDQWEARLHFWNTMAKRETSK